MARLRTPTVCPGCGAALPESLSKREQIIDTLRTRPDLRIKQIAWMFEVSTKTVGLYIKEAGVKRRRVSTHVPITPAPLVILRCPACRHAIPETKMNMSGDVIKFIKHHPELMYKEIALRFGLDLRTLKRYAKRGGVKRRCRAEQPGMMTTGEVMAAIGVTRKTLFMWRRRGIITATKQHDRTLVYDRLAVEALISAPRRRSPSSQG